MDHGERDEKGAVAVISVFDIGNTNYTGLGDCVLAPVSATVTQEAGGSYQIQLEHPIDPEGKWLHLVTGAIVRAPIPAETIENAWTGYEAWIYTSGSSISLRESASEPTAVSYADWVAGGNYQVGSKVSYYGKNYQCINWDESSGYIMVPPNNCSWWREIATTTGGAAVVATVAAGTELYWVEGNTGDEWWKMSTYYGVEGWCKSALLTLKKHLTPEETVPREVEEQLFRLISVTVQSEGNTVTAEGTHVSYDLAGDLVNDVVISQASPAMAIGRVVDGLMVEYPGTIATNMTSTEAGTYSGSFKGKNGIHCLLDPDSGIAAQFDAKVIRDNWDIFIMQWTDTDRGLMLRYGNNATGITWKRDTGSIITRVVPYARTEGGDDLYLPEVWVDSPLINQYPVVRMEKLKVDGQVGKVKDDGSGATWTEAELLAEMRSKANARFETDRADEVASEISVDFTLLGDTAEYAWAKGLQKALLYDIVTARDERIGLDAKLRVTEIEFDCIQKRITAMKLSNIFDHGGKNVTGYNVQNASIGSEKLKDEVRNSIVNEAVSIMPEYKGEKTPVVDALTSTSRDSALSANMGRELAGRIADKHGIEYMDITDACPINLRTAGGGTITNGNFVAAKSTGTEGAVCEFYVHSGVPYVQMKDYLTGAAITGTRTVRVYYRV